MKKLKVFFCVALLFISNGLVFADYIKPALVSEHVWNEVLPYLMPDDHPARKKLDKLFNSFRVTENARSISKAGFKNYIPGQFSHAIVSKNKKIKGYYFKFYSDEQYIEDESKQWLERAFEARSLAAAIRSHGYDHYFSVPEKWIYPLPDFPKSNSPHPKSFILVAKCLDIEKRKKSREKWRSKVTPALLDALYILVVQEGLNDSLIASNLPFTKNNKLAFIDLEHHHKWPIPFYKLNTYLNSEMQAYWKSLTHQ